VKPVCALGVQMPESPGCPTGQRERGLN